MLVYSMLNGVPTYIPVVCNEYFCHDNDRIFMIITYLYGLLSTNYKLPKKGDFHFLVCIL